MSVVVYGVETLKMCRITSFDTQSVFTDDGIDFLYRRHRVTVNAVVSLDLETPGLTLGAVEARITRNLHFNRQPLEVFIGERPAASDEHHSGLEDHAEGTSDPTLAIGAPDIHGGPFCEDVQFTGYAGTRTAFMTATFVAHDHVCGAEPAILANRFRVTNSIDQNHFTRQTISGRLHANPRYHMNADELRESVIKPMPAGFVPESAEFTQDTTGLILDYNLVYVEKYQLPPTPFTTLSVDYNESTTFGALCEAELIIVAEAAKTTTRTDMLQRLSQIVLSYFDFQKQAQNGDIMLGCNVGGSATENRMNLMVRARKHNPQNAPAAGVFTPLDPLVFGKPLAGSRAFVDDMPSRGTALQKAVAAVWKYACANGGKANGQQAAGSNIPPSEDAPLTYSTGDLPSMEENKLSLGNVADPYKLSKQLIDYRTDNGVFTLPMGQAVEGGSLGGGDKTASQVRLYQPYTEKTVRYNAERHNQWPEMPSPKTQLDGAVVLRHSVETESPDLGADLNNFVYSASGEHVVALDHAIDPTTKNLTGGVSPAYTLDVSDSGVPTGCFRGDLAEDSSGVE